MTSHDRELHRALEAAFGAAIPVSGDESVEAVWSIGEVELGLSVSPTCSLNDLSKAVSPAKAPY